MKKFTKALCSILVTTALLFNLTACSSETKEENTAITPTTSVTTDPGTATTAPEATVAAADKVILDKVAIPSDLPKKKIGVIYNSYTDKLGSQLKAALESLAEPFNVEFNFIETGTSQEQGQSIVDSALQTGLDGVLSVTVTAAQLETGKKSGNIPFVCFGGSPVDAAAVAEITSYDNYLGAIVNSDFMLGQQACDALYNAGCRNIAVCGISPGLAKNQDDRLAGFKEQIKKYPDMKIIAEDLSHAAWANAIAAFAAAYPEMDGLFSTAANESVYQAMQTAGLIGSVKLATADVSESTPDYLDNGTIVYIAGGQYNTIMSAFAVLYNYLYDGTRIIPDSSKTVETPFVALMSADDLERYSTYIESDTMVYTPEEMASMIIGINSNFTPEKFVKFNANFGLADVAERHKDLK